MSITQFTQYQASAIRTAKEMGPRMDLIHAALGLAGEVGEFVDAVKRHVIYGKPLDRENAAEEIGDVLWFCALACETLGISMADVASHNIDKLRQRYPEKYTDTHAAARLDKSDGMLFSYGNCPTCGAPGISRERSPNGNDTCTNGHIYPSATAVHNRGLA